MEGKAGKTAGIGEEALQGAAGQNGGRGGGVNRPQVQPILRTGSETGAIPKAPRTSGQPPVQPQQIPGAYYLQPPGSSTSVEDRRWMDMMEFGQPARYRPTSRASSFASTRHPSLEELRDRLIQEEKEAKIQQEKERWTAEILRTLERSRKAHRAEKEFQEYQQKKKEAEAIQHRLETDADDEGFTTDASAVTREVEKMRRKIERRNMRRGDSTVSSSTGDDLTVPFRNLQKVVYNLNDKETREDSDTLEKNVKYLDRVTADTISEGVRNSFKPIEKRIDERIARAMANMAVEMGDEVYKSIQEKYEPRIKRMEEQEKLSTRVAVEKKDQLVPLPIYPRLDASDEVFTKAIHHLNSIAKVIERTCPFKDQPFNFLFQIAAESTVIAKNFKLSKSQQYNLIFSHIPLRHPVRFSLAMNKTLQDLLSMISTSSSMVFSRYGLEKMINSWRLDNRTESDMHLSLAKLGDLLDRNRDDYNVCQCDPATMMREIITIIQRQEGLPRFLRDDLHAARLMIHERDTPAEMYRILVAACIKYVGMRAPRSAQVRTEMVPNHEHDDEEENGEEDEGEDAGADEEYEYEENDEEDDQEDDDDNGEQEDSSNSSDDSDSREKAHRSEFVKQWPADKQYLASNGTFRSDFESHFSGYCMRCGHCSHYSDRCWLYREACKDLCKICLQGLHTTCKSRRRDIQQAVMENKIMQEVRGYLSKYLPAPPPPGHVYVPTPAPNQE